MMSTMVKLIAWHANKQRKSKWPLMKPWAMVNDGDLWEQASGIISQRGPASVKLTKVKGHATEEQVKQGTVRKDDLEGNNQAEIIWQIKESKHTDQPYAKLEIYLQRDMEPTPD